MRGIVVKLLFFCQCNFRFNHPERYLWQVDAGYLTIWFEVLLKKAERRLNES